MKHKRKADMVLVLHIAFIIFFVAGAAYSFIDRAYAPYQTIVVFLAIMSNVVWSGCPFTHWERKYRILHDPDCGYKKSFYAQYFFGPIFGIEPSILQIRIFLLLTKVIPGLLPLLIILDIL